MAAVTLTIRSCGRPLTAAVAVLGILAVVAFGAPAAAQSQGAAADMAAEPGDSEVQRGLGIEAIRELGEPLGEPLQGEELREAVARVAADIRCPKCQALSIADSAAQSAQAMREEARALLAAGYTGEQVTSYFEGRYGEFVLLEPRPRGLNLIVWTAPAAIVLVGALLVAQRLRRRRRRGDDRSLDSYLRQVEQETAT